MELLIKFKPSSDFLFIFYFNFPSFGLKKYKKNLHQYSSLSYNLEIKIIFLLLLMDLYILILFANTCFQ